VFPEIIGINRLTESEISELNNYELYFLNLGVGEVSVPVKAMSVYAEGRRALILTDDKTAAKKFKKIFF
jgi:hypothetical protein